MLRVDALSAKTGTARVTFVAESGACTGLLGPSAASLVDVIAGLSPAGSGRVACDVAMSDAAHMLTGTSAMDPRLSAVEYLVAVAGARRASGQTLRVAATDALRRLALSPSAPLTAPDVRRAVALAAALLPDAPLVLLRDPLAGLTPAARDGAVQWIHALTGAGVCVVASFSAEGDARSVSHRVVLAGDAA